MLIAVKLAKPRRSASPSRTRYWELWMHFVREMYLKGMLSPHLVDTTEEIADVLTKAMSNGTNIYYKFRNYIMNIA